MVKLLISSCLLGNPVRYDALSKKCNNPFFEKILKFCELYPVCPEVDGGLPIPRPPSEIVFFQDDKFKLINKNGEDVTSFFEKGAKNALEIALKNGIKVALLKSKSPSCGNDFVYDGTFSSTLIKGKGVTAYLLEKYGIKVFNENELEKLWDYLKSI